ncbi:hypothetical protein ACJMK2_007435, partial [Sinanodonta woodiana]
MIEKNYGEVNNLWLKTAIEQDVPKATTETVWLKDVTTRLQRDKRSIGMSDHPEKLTFLLKRNSDTLTLNLKRNDNVDPNADLYTVRNLDDGRSIVEKTVDAEKEVDQLYAGINDPNIEIHVKIRGFVLCKLQGQFIHQFSQVQIVDGSTMINATTYLIDLLNMDLNGAFSQIPEYDQVILFTRHTLYLGDTNCKTGGVSYPGQICVPGYRVELVRILDYFRTISTAAHELGHSLGALHDGDDTARGCKAEDGFIMAPVLPDVVPYKPYSKNHWKFSTCSVEAFKRTIVYKPDLKKKPVYTQPELDEWNKFMAKLPGQKYSPSMQCQFIIGPGSSVCD